MAIKWCVWCVSLYLNHAFNSPIIWLFLVLTHCCLWSSTNQAQHNEKQNFITAKLLLEKSKILLYGISKYASNMAAGNDCYAMFIFWNVLPECRAHTHTHTDGKMWLKCDKIPDKGQVLLICSNANAWSVCSFATVCMKQMQEKMDRENAVRCLPPTRQCTTVTVIAVLHWTASNPSLTKSHGSVPNICL